MGRWDCVEAGPNGARIRVRLTPSGRADAVDGVHEDSAGQWMMKARVRAAPEDGAANEALCALFAKVLGLPKRSIRLVKGPKARVKTLEAEGLSVEDAVRRLGAILGEAGR